MATEKESNDLLSKCFGFDAKTMNVKTEIMAGITTFLTMAYILAVNPNIFSALDMPQGAVFTATALAAVIGTLVMALWAKRPFALAPGMGLNAFFVYTVCLGMGHPWQFALTAVFVEGIIFIILTITNVRKAIVDAIPMSVRKAIGVGIGFYIAFIGLKNGEIIVDSESTFVTLGEITKGPALLACIGILITGAMVIMNVKGSILIGILATTIIGIPMGITHFGGIISKPASISDIAFQFRWGDIFTLDFVVVLFTFLFIDMFDTIGTIIGVSQKAGQVDKDGNIPRIKEIFMADAIATLAGSCMGTSTTTTYVESASGVAAGGRSGLTAFTVAICFGIAVFFSPLFLSIPSAATTAALFIVGLFMISSIKDIDFENYSDSIAAFMTIIAMPLTYSISDGIMLGVITYVVLNLCSGRFSKLNVGMYILAVLFILKYIFI
ncbi:MAG: NCS2 family permease [Bacteroidales bacterium]|nr:NCS2 family permease [Bacteroidales bacterium]